MKAEQEAMETSGRELPGFRKRSFALPYRGGMIWFEHLDGLGRSCQLTLEKLRADEPTFHLPSAPGCVAFVLTDSKITPEITEALVRTLTETEKPFRRVAFIGADGKVRRELSRRLMSSGVAVHFEKDVEKAKEWLIPEKG